MQTIRAFFDQVPFFRLTIGLIAGIIGVDYFNPGINPEYYLLAIGLLLVALVVLIKRESVFSTLLLAILPILGAFQYEISYPEARQSDSEKQFYRVMVINAPHECSKTYKVEGKVIPEKSSLFLKKEKVLLYLPKSEGSRYLLPGDYLFLHGKLNEPHLKGNPYEFNYPEYLKKKGISRTCYSTDENWQKHSSYGFTIKRWAEITRRKVISIYQSAEIDEQELAILCALTLGYRDLLDESTELAFSNSGTMHILAVSGLHVGIIYGLFSGLFMFLFKHKRKTVRAIILIIILWSFAFISGFAPSVIRSSLMFSFIVVAQTLRRKARINNSIFASAFIILLFDPLILFHVGFQLSYIAVISIVYFQPKLYHLIVFTNAAMDNIWKLFTVSIAVQIGSFPIFVYYFHTFPNYFWLSNFFAIPLAGIIIKEAIILILISPLITVLPYWGIFISTTVKCLHRCTLWIANLPGALLSDIYPSQMQLLLIYCFIIFLSGYFMQPKRKINIYISLIALLGISVIQFEKIIINRTQNELIIYNDSKNLVINLISGKDNYIITDASTSDSIIYKLGISIWKNQHTNTPHRINFGSEELFIPGFRYSHPFIMYDKKIMIIADESIRTNTIKNFENIDQLLITRKARFESLKNSKQINQQIIFSPNCYTRQKKFWTQKMRHNVPYFDVKRDGAWIYVFRTRLKTNIKTLSFIHLNNTFMN